MKHLWYMYPKTPIWVWRFLIDVDAYLMGVGVLSVGTLAILPPTTAPPQTLRRWETTAIDPPPRRPPRAAAAAASVDVSKKPLVAKDVPSPPPAARR